MYTVESKFFLVCEKLMNIAILNILWLLFSIPIITIIPSTYAMFDVIRVMRTEPDVSIPRVFWKSFTNGFFKSYKLLGFISVAIIISLLDVVIFANGSGDLQQLLHYFFLILTVLLSMIGLFVIPIHLKYRLSIAKSYMLALVMLISQPFLTLAWILGVIMLITIAMVMPGLGVIVFMGVLAEMVDLVVRINFEKIEALIGNPLHVNE